MTTPITIQSLSEDFVLAEVQDLTHSASVERYPPSGQVLESTIPNLHVHVLLSVICQQLAPLEGVLHACLHISGVEYEFGVLEQGACAGVGTQVPFGGVPTQL